MRSEALFKGARGGGWRRGVFTCMSAVVAVLGLMWGNAARAQTVLACEPEWAALTRVLLPQARIHTATHARQDPHHIEARPALIAQMRSAELAVCTGASLEVGWLPMLQERSGNPKVQDGAPGMFYAASHVTLLNPHKGMITPFDGDVHAEGNPHLHADPRRLLNVAKALSQRMQALWPGQAPEIERRYIDFERRWKASMSAWELKAAPLRGRALAGQHATFTYLWEWLGLRQSVDLEPQPGMSPTPGHLQKVLSLLRAEPPLAIVLASHQDPRSGRWLAAQLGGAVPVLSLPATVTGPSNERVSGLGELQAWFDHLLDALLQASAATPGARG